MWCFLLWRYRGVLQMRATVPTTYNIYLVLVSCTVLASMPWSFVSLQWMRLAGLRVKVQPVERWSVESADGGIACRAGRMLGAAMPRLKECLVKLQSARSMPGSMARLSNIVAGLLMCLQWCILLHVSVMNEWMNGVPALVLDLSLYWATAGPSTLPLVS
jgi:hypothetical protein